MVRYTIPGALPAPWEDFMGLDGAPNVTITTLDYLKANNFGGEPETEGVQTTPDGWVEVIINVPMVTAEVAVEWLAVINNVRTENVCIESKEYCFSM